MMRISQTKLEHLLHVQHVEESVKQELLNDLYPNVSRGVAVYTDWLADVKWVSHEYRKSTIADMDRETIVIKVLSKIVLNCRKALPLISIAGMINLSPTLDKLENVQLSCDLIALLESSDLYSIETSAGGTKVVQTTVELSEELIRQIRVGCYLPPMIEKPQRITANDQSGYLTINKDSMILGGIHNQHSGNISLDVINTLNSNEYELDTFVTMQEKPWHREYLTPLDIYCLREPEREIYRNELITRELYLEQFNYLKDMLKDRTLHFNHKPDKRGRIYCQGYHFSTQGSSYEKACLNLKKKVFVTGTL